MPALQFKQNITICFSLSNLTILAKASQVFFMYNYDCIVTGGLDGSHSQESAHYRNQALDFRAHHIKDADRESIYQALQTQFPTTTYLVLWEARGTPEEHYHIQTRG